MTRRKNNRPTLSWQEARDIDFSLPHSKDLELSDGALAQENILKELGMESSDDKEEAEKIRETNNLLLDIADILSLQDIPEGGLVSHVLANKDLYFSRIEQFENPQFLPNYINENDLRVLAASSGVEFYSVFTVIQCFLSYKYLYASKSFCTNILDPKVPDNFVKKEYQELSRDHVWGDKLYPHLASAPELAGLIAEQEAAVEEMAPRSPNSFVSRRLQMAATVLSPSPSDLKSLDPTAIFWTDYAAKVSPKRKEKEIEWLNYFLSKPYLYVFDLVVNTIGKKDFSHLLEIWTRRYADQILNPNSQLRIIFLLICQEHGVSEKLKEILSHRLGVLNKKQSQSEEPVASAKPKHTSIITSTRARVSLVVPPIKPLSEKIEKPSFAPEPADILANKIPAPKEIPAGCILKVKITQASKSAIYRVPQERQEFTSVSLIQNEDTTFSFPEDLDWEQPGKNFGFEFFFEKSGQKSDFSSMVKVLVPAEKKEETPPENTPDEPVEKEEEVELSFDLIPVGPLQTIQGTVNPYGDLLEIARSQKRIAAIVSMDPEKDAREAWEVVFEDGKASARAYAKRYLQESSEKGYYQLSFPPEYRVLLEGGVYNIPENLGISYDPSTQKINFNYSFIPEWVAEAFAQEISEKLARKRTLLKISKAEIQDGLGEGGEGSDSTKLADDFETQRKKKRPQIRFLCFTGEDNEVVVRGSGDLEAEYEKLVDQYGEHCVFVLYRRQKVNLFGKKLESEGSFDTDDFDREIGVKVRAKTRDRINKYTSDRNFDVAYESPSKLEIFEHRIASHLGLIRDKENERTALTNGSEEALHVLMDKEKLVFPAVPKDEIPSGWRAIKRSDVNSDFVRIFLDHLQEDAIDVRINFSPYVFATLERHKKNVLELAKN